MLLHLCDKLFELEVVAGLVMAGLAVAGLVTARFVTVAGGIIAAPERSPHRVHIALVDVVAFGFILDHLESPVPNERARVDIKVTRPHHRYGGAAHDFEAGTCQKSRKLGWHMTIDESGRAHRWRGQGWGWWVC